MRRRRVLVGLVVLALAAVTAILLWPRGPRPCRATFELVREGMTYDEVCVTVGGPPGVYSNRLEYPFVTGGGPGVNHKFWTAADSTLYVVFDVEKDRAVVAGVSDPPPDNRPLWDRLRSRLGL